jgi:hypothetical protein
MNTTKRNYLPFIFALCISLFVSCAKDQNVVFENNKPIDPDGVPTIVVENYVNRMFIDLLGRAPTDIELKNYTDQLVNNDLAEATRVSIVQKLQSDTIDVNADGKYRDVYYYNFYNAIKAKCIEGAPDSELRRIIGIRSNSIRIARLLGDSIRVHQDSSVIRRTSKLLEAQLDYQNGNIDIRDYFEFALNNPVYDNVNMNSFNFVNASFDDLFGRFPTDYEFTQAYEIIEFNRAGFLFGNSATNKNEYCRVLTASNEFSEGVIRWQYNMLLAREPNTAEIAQLMNEFHATKNVQWLQQQIVKTNEYANFK